MKPNLSPLGTLVMFLTRIAIGWHFLYEGLTKVLDPKWSAGPTLEQSVGPCAAFFKSLTAEGTIRYVDFANRWGLTLIGAALILGLLTRFASIAGMALLAMYYLVFPPFPGVKLPPGAEGSYLIVNKNFIELIALLAVTVFPAAKLGLDGLISGWLGSRDADAYPPPLPGEPDAASRRSVLASLVGVPFAGAFALAYLKRHGWSSHEENNLDAFSGASSKRAAELLKPSGGAIGGPSAAEIAKGIKGTLPMASIGKMRLSRMILGGNLIGGWAHARDLIYVSSLVKAYHTREKIFQTFQYAEACGVNTILTNPMLCPVINAYWKDTGGKILFISDCGDKDLLGAVQKSIGNGAASCYVQGGVADNLVKDEKFDLIAQALELTRKAGLPAGIGAHKLKTVTACVEKGLIPDYWMKTLHETNYWSARPGEKQCDNIFCEEPAETIAFMKDRPEPWIAFKILAAGAIRPKQGFKYAFDNGADFICVGMYDFQIVEDVNLALDVLNGKLSRQRAWRAV